MSLVGSERYLKWDIWGDNKRRSSKGSKGREQAGLGVQGGLRLLSEYHTPSGCGGGFLNKTPRVISWLWIGLFWVWDLCRRSEFSNTAPFAISPCQSSLDRPCLVLGWSGGQCWTSESLWAEAGAWALFQVTGSYLREHMCDCWLQILCPHWAEDFCLRIPNMNLIGTILLSVFQRRKHLKHVKSLQIDIKKEHKTPYLDN